MKQASSKTAMKRQQGKGKPGGERSAPCEPSVAIMLRPKLAQKMCAEQVADQIGVKRSQLDPNFYLTGVLLMGIERVGKAEKIGTWSRKEAAIFLKSAFLPLFELLYEQEELPLVFDLLLARGVPQAAPAPPVARLSSLRPSVQAVQREPAVAPYTESYLPLLSMDAEIGLDGFPGGI